MGPFMLPSSLVLLFSLLFTASIAPDFVLDDTVSFGTDGQIHFVNNKISGWNLFGEGHAPQMLSDRVILTPPAPGNTKGAMWSEKPTTSKHWMAEVSFRASGQERGSGNFQIWYAKDGHSEVSSSSIYTVGKFQGLAVVIDQHGGHGGMLRAFLNDGSSNYKTQGGAAVDSLAFGHCQFAYRNLGAPSKITLVNDPTGFRVDIDEQQCFYSAKVNMPAGYRFGMTATTAENPDSIELSRFVVSFATSDKDKAPVHEQVQHHEQHSQEQRQQPFKPAASSGNVEELLQKIKAQTDRIASLEQELKDVHQGYNKFFESATPKLIQQLRDHERMAVDVKRVNDDVMALKHAIDNNEILQAIKRIGTSIENIRGSHESLPAALGQIITGSAPKMGLIVFIFVGAQVGVIAAYALYKKRRDSAPKKYL